jgi:hypothetical protein
MKEQNYKFFENADIQNILLVLDEELKKRNESPIWRERVVPFSKAILSVLAVLKENDMLFTPEGEAVEKLTPELFFRWSDFVSLKSLFFTIKKSNEAGVLLRTKLNEDRCQKYKQINLDTLGEYLSINNVNLEKESLDFPIATYNLHQGVSNVIKSLFNEN